MNVRLIIGLILLFNCFQHLAIAEEKRFPLMVKSGHLLPEWRLNDSIQTKVMLETGFPKIVISESFALKHLKHLVKFETAAKNTSIRLWGTANKIKVSYLIRDTLYLKDTTQFKPNPHTKSEIIMPNKFYLNDISCKDEYIVAMRMFKGHSQKYSGIIGNRFFSHFIIAFDFEKKKIFIKANSDKVKVSDKF